MEYGEHALNVILCEYLFYKKKAIRIFSKARFRESCREIFKRLNVLTLPCMYIFETILFCLTKCNLEIGTNFHNHNTRYADHFRNSYTRLHIYDQLPCLAGVKLYNKLPENLKLENNFNHFKQKLKLYLLNQSFYSVGEFMCSQ